jgi:hypothetical protein
LRRIVGVAGALALVSGAIVSTAAPASADSTAAAIVRSVNASRVAHGLRPYVWRSDLSSVAQAWSVKMARASRLSHNPRLATQVTNFRWVGENVGYGPTWLKVEQAFMRSTAHRANILDRQFTQIGIGVSVSGGRIWITQVFRQPYGATASAAKPVQRTVTSFARAKPAAAAPVTRVVAKATSSSARPAARAVPARLTATPNQLLAERVAVARAAISNNNDPLARALAYAATMRAVAG